MKSLSTGFLLLVLYTLQGIPLGLSGTIPFILEKRISFSDQALFACVSWPFSLKLLWAPLVDSLFWRGMGRRKTWVIPTQLICGALMLWVSLSGNLSIWMGDDDKTVDILKLTVFFVVLYFLMATQDIAVDGWALTLLPQDEQHLAGTINAAGQTLGYFLAYVVFLVLNNGEYCDKLRSIPNGQPILQLDEFFSYSGIAFILCTLYVIFFIREKPYHMSTTTSLIEDKGDNETSESLGEIFNQFGLLFKNKPIQILAILLFTQGAALSAQSAGLQLKVVHAGFPPAELAVLSPIFIGIGIVLPVIMSWFLNKDNQLIWLWRSMLLQLLLVPLGTLLPRLVENDVNISSSSAPPSINILILVIVTVIVATIQSNIAFCAQLSFFPAIADPVIGGTYVTLLTTLSNASKSFIRPVSMFIIQKIDDFHLQYPSSPTAILSGYEITSLICGGISILWIIFALKPIRNLQKIPIESWWVRKEKKLE